MLGKKERRGEGKDGVMFTCELETAAWEIGCVDGWMCCTDRWEGESYHILPAGLFLAQESGVRRACATYFCFFHQPGHGCIACWTDV